jgi:signal transduction histidine kinase
MPQDLLSKSKVLIVDDEPSNVRLLERILEMFGNPEVRSTTDSREALQLYFEFDPDIVLLDLHMPHLDGFGVLDQLKAANPPETYLPILVLTADITSATKRRALAMGAKDLVIKPVDNFEVILRINHLLENRFLHGELQRQNGMLEQQVRERTAQLEETLHQLRSTQEQVVKQERLRALGMMAGGIAHDFNNALTMVLGYGELLLPCLQQQERSKEQDYLLNMIAAAQDATHVVSRLREFYRPASGQEIRVAIDLNALIEQAVSLTSPKWKGRSQADGVQITVETELREIPLVAGNAPELREVFTNLIFNAVDAMPTGGKITISTRAHDHGAIVDVRDTGIGMTESERERCLEPFFTTKGDGGTGLGLSVVYGIIQRHEGKIEIASTKGEGTTFSIALPTADIAVVETPVSTERVERTLRILVVDDQEIICELLSEYLKSDGHETVMAGNGKEALDVFRGGAFDLVITDQSMPQMNGVQLGEAIEEFSPQTPTILLTGFGEEMQEAGTMPRGIDLVVSKPVSIADLRKAIHQIVAAPPIMAAA